MTNILDINLTTEQETAVTTILDYVKSGNTTEDNHWHILTGAGGTGKSLTTSYIVRELTNLGIDLTIIAPTWTAVRQLETYLNDQADDEFSYYYDVNTVAKYCAKVPSICNKSGKQKFVSNKYKQGDLAASVVLFDEISMLSVIDLKEIEKTWKEGMIFIGVGDDSQLAPVQKAKGIAAEVSPIFTLGYPTVTLNTTHRFSEGSGIAEATNLIRTWNFPTLKGFNYLSFIKLMDKFNDVEIYTDKEVFETALLEDMLDIESPDDVKHLAWTNSEGDKINKEIRSTIYNRKSTKFYKDDYLVAYKPLTRYGASPNHQINAAKKDLTRISNNADTFTLIDEIKSDVYIQKDYKDYPVAYKEWNAFCYESDKTITVRLADPTPKNIKNLKYIFNDLQSRAKEFPENSRKRSNLLSLSFKFVELFDRLKFGWASTVHKAQGKGYPTVYVNASFITRNHPEVQSLLYTATSRAKTKLCIYLPDNLPGVNRVLDLTKR